MAENGRIFLLEEQIQQRGLFTQEKNLPLNHLISFFMYILFSSSCFCCSSGLERRGKEAWRSEGRMLRTLEMTLRK